MPPFHILRCITAYICTVSAIQLQNCALKINGTNYKKEIISVKGVDITNPFNFAIEHYSNALYTCNLDRKKKEYESIRINLNTSEGRVIEELRGVCSFAVDQRRGSVFAGCGDGLHHYDTNVRQFVSIGDKKAVVYVHYYNDTLFYIPARYEPVFKFSYFDISAADEFAKDVYRFVVDKDDDIISKKPGSLILQRPGSGGSTQYTGYRYVDALAVDSRGVAYVCDSIKNQISTLDKGNATFVRFADADRCQALAFDIEDNIVYADMKLKKIVPLSKC